VTDYTTKSYGRTEVVLAIYRMFDDGRDVHMPGPRRLGKTFVLDRMVDAGAKQGWHAVKIEIAGCRDTRAVFRLLCEAIGRERPGGAHALSWIKQRMGQVLSPRSDQTGAWYQPLLSLDHEAWFERMVNAMNDDKSHRWALLIDELPIFLKALHDRGPEGIALALDFMNLTSRLRQANPRVRWLITGSIGIEPLAQEGNYLGVLAKFQHFELNTLSQTQASDYVQDLARSGQLPLRRSITPVEAQAVVAATGWRAAFYLDALAQKLAGEATQDPEVAARHVAKAVNDLLQPAHMATFGPAEEHIRKHYRSTDRAVAFTVLNALAPHPAGLTLDILLTTLHRPELTDAQLRKVIRRLQMEGFVTVGEWDEANPTCAFLNPLQRGWWHRFPPDPTA
jgi:uncharacterized protein